jgi:hypothetical protein
MKAPIFWMLPGDVVTFGDEGLIFLVLHVEVSKYFTSSHFIVTTLLDDSKSGVASVTYEHINIQKEWSEWKLVVKP